MTGEPYFISKGSHLTKTECKYAYKGNIIGKIECQYDMSWPYFSSPVDGDKITSFRIMI